MKRIHDTPDKNQDILISNLEKELSELEGEKYSLKSDIKKFKKQKYRYYNIFKNSTVAIWEEDFSEAFKILKKLPCRTKEEYSNYLYENPVLLKDMIDKIKVLDINQTTVELFGAESKEMLVQSLDKIFIKESYNTFIDQFVTIATGGFHYECETIGRRLNGEEFHIILSVFFPDTDGKSVFITMVEITDRIKKEREQDRIFMEILEEKKNADTLIDITFALASKTDKNDILDFILEQTEKIVPYSSANIMLTQKDTMVVVKHRGYGRFGAEKFITKLAENIVSKGSIKTFKNNHLTQIIEDTQVSEDWKYIPETKYIKSVLSIPIEWQGEVLGLLNLDSTEKNTFSQNHLYVLKPICHAAAIAIQKVRIFEQIEKDIAQRKITEENLRLALKEKDLLLQEIHHRVKNNLTIIIALINLQDTKFANPSEIVLFEELSQRIYAIALVHEKLYENHNLASIDFFNYTTDLINSIKDVLIYRSDIYFNINIPKDIYFSLDKLIPLGLILNELLTNSLKYAFINSGGEITVTLIKSKTDNYYTLIVTDNGVGYPPSIFNGNNKHLGLLLVNSLILQIKGSVNFLNNKGAIVKIIFSASENSNE